MNTDILRIAMAQLKPVLGDFAGNLEKVCAARRVAAEQGADLVVCPELALCGNRPEGLVLMPAFQDACRATLETLAARTADGGPAVLAGLPWVEGGRLFNAVALVDGGVVVAVRFKADLAERGVFSEAGLFAAGPMPGPIGFRGVRLGVPVGEDLRGEEVVECLAETGAEILLVPGAWPYHRTRTDARLNVAVARVTESGLPLLCVNEAGGQDGIVFDGASFVLNADRSLAVQLPAFAENIVTTTWRRGEDGWVCDAGPVASIEEGDEADYRACVLGLRDQVLKNDFAGVAVDRSAGNGAALAAMMAADAIGAELVHDAATAPAGTLVLATANRTDLAIGAGHLRGDFNPLAALYAGEADRLGTLRTAWRPPDSRAPADMTYAPAGTTDAEALPETEVLDDIVRSLTERAMRVSEVAAAGHDADMVRRIAGLIVRAGAGRRQAPPGIMLSMAGSGTGQDLPVSHRFRDEGRPAFTPDTALYRLVTARSVDAIDV